MLTRVSDCKLIQLPKMTDQRGNLSVVEGDKNIPFAIKRIFYIYDIPTGESRGAHAHKHLHQFLLCLGGSFEVELDDGENTSTIPLNRPWVGLHIPPMIWASEVRFSPGSLCLVLCSDTYDETDYIRNYADFIGARQKQC